MKSILSLFLFLFVSCSLLNIYALTDVIAGSQSLKDGETLVSNGGSFEMGFFSPGHSKDRYLGIWYKSIPVRTVVWVANRISPIKDLSGLLMISNTGSLVISNGTNSVIWSANFTRMPQDPVFQLLDSGNLVARNMGDDSGDNYPWQSFDYPTDTLLPGMKLGWDLRTHLNRRLSSWKSSDDPSPGQLSTGIELNAYPQAAMFRGTRKFFRGGPWNGLRFSGAPELKKNSVFDFNFVSNNYEVYYTYQLGNKSVISRFILNETTMTRQRYVWAESDMSWKLFSSVPRDYCDTYGLCGANGICVISDSPVCKCLEGFKPKVAWSWNSMDWSQGCILEKDLDCTKRRDFLKVSGVKLPDTTYTWLNGSMNLKKCKEVCLQNCSCMAYSNSNISGRGNGCALWFGDLIDIRQLFEGGQDLYLRVPSSSRASRSWMVIVMIIVPTAAICALLLLISYFYKQRRKSKGENGGDHSTVAEREDLGLPLLNLATISHATGNFSAENRLGEGGFGPVYKGVLADGQNIAVKRLSKNSGQGLNEFENEVKLIAKLQHRNLVRLLAFCIEEDEKLLVYELMPNGSLASFIFGQSKGLFLNWSQRFNIICGIARGLLYLHQDSRFRIIHRDLKASNVLLDDALNPKISDFGMARSFGGDQLHANTRRIVGTYGYMAPEYALYGLVSVKSDVFSLGILLLEVISGKKNTGFDNPQSHQNLIGYAWELWREGRALELIDVPLDEDVAMEHEALRCIHVGLLCIQQNPDDRPNMSTVVLMLNGENTLPQPKEPGFLIDVIQSEASSLSTKNSLHSVNDITITTMEGR